MRDQIVHHHFAEVKCHLYIPHDLCSSRNSVEVAGSGFVCIVLNESGVERWRSWQHELALREAKRQHPKPHPIRLRKVEDRQRLCEGVRLWVDQYDVAGAVQVVVTIGVQLIKVGLAELILLSPVLLRRIQQLPLRIQDQARGLLLLYQQIGLQADLKAEDLERTRSLMNAHVRDSLVTGFEHLIQTVELPDSDDRHVVAAAIHGGASLIVTFNLKDFPPERLKPYNLAAQHPDDFIFDLLDLHAARVCEAAANHRRSLKNPPKTADEYLDTLLKQGLTQTVGQLREWKVAI